MLILQAKSVDIDNQTVTATDGVRQMYVYIPKRNPIRVPQPGEWFEAENIGRRLVVKTSITSDGSRATPGAFNLSAAALNVTVNGDPVFFLSGPGYAF